jgi:hypothetical protein
VARRDLWKTRGCFARDDDDLLHSVPRRLDTIMAIRHAVTSADRPTFALIRASSIASPAGTALAHRPAPLAAT